MRGVLTAVALTLALLLGAGGAQAQTSVRLVSNTGQASTGEAGFSQDYSQGFVTGGNADGYRLTHVELEMRSTASTSLTYSVAIWRIVNEKPSQEVGMLTNPDSLPTSFETVRFTPTADINLDPRRRYAIVVDVSAGDDTTALRTTGASATGASAEDAGGGEGWRITDDTFWRKNSADAWVTGGRAAKIAIHGYARDTTAPELLGGTIHEATVKLYFSEDLDTTQTLVTGAFTVTSTPALGVVSSPTFNSSENNIIELTVATAANNSQTATIAITTPVGIRDTAGNALAAISSFSLTNIRASAPAAPRFSRAVVLSDTLTLTYNGRLLPRFPPPSAFTVSVAGRPNPTVSSLAINPGDTSTVVLTLSAPVQRTDDVQLSYSKTPTPKLQNEWGNQTSELFDHSVRPLSCTMADTAVSGVPNGSDNLAGDCTVLLWLMHPLAGPLYEGLDWETGTTMADWNGITVATVTGSNTARVTGLDLSNEYLTGSLPASLTSLTGLTSLSLANNYLSGPIPSLEKLKKLGFLYLNDNNLSGLIPPSLADLDELVFLSLGNNRLTGRIPSLSDLTKLRLLYLNDNNLSGSIPALSSLTSLLILDLSNNRLTGPIPALSSLASLLILDLENNQLRGSIPALSSLTSLQTLDLSNNRLTGDLPSSLSGRTSLTHLDLSHNTFAAKAIPSWVNTLTGLTHLDLSHTNRTDTIPTLGDLASLQRLRLHTNPLSGELPTTWGGASSLRLLDLRHTGVQSDPLPTALQGQTNLTVWRSLPSVTLSADATHPVKASTIALIQKGTATPQPLVYRAGAPAGTSFPTAGEVYKITALDSSATPITTALETALEVCFPLPATLPASRADLYGYQPHATDPENQPGRWERLTTGRRTETENYVIDPGGLDQLWEREVRVCAAVNQFSHFRVGRYTSSGGGGGGGGGRGGSSGRDRHGNTAATATPIAFRPASPRAGSIAGQINTRSDVDYFRLRLAQAGVLVIETNGSTDTWGKVWQAGEELAAATSGGPETNFRLATPVEAGDVVIAVAGEGGRTGAYTLRARLVVSHLENPTARSFQSGLGLISGWVCEAEGVTVEIEQEDGTVVELAAAYGTARADTADVCGDSDNGFGLLFNWNLLGDGDHAVRVLVDGVALGVQVVPGVGPVPAVVDGIEIGQAPVTVTTLGEEFRRGLAETFVVEDFPRPGEQVHLVWQESQQNFVLAPAELGAAVTPAPGSGGIEGVLENPTPASFQSGIGVISGWGCEAEEVVIEIDGQPITAAAGTERADTLDTCGDVDNGFGLLVNWAEFGAGEHEVVALVDGVELSRATVTVTVVDETEPYVRGLAKRVELPRFPTPEETVTLEWQESQQNFVITGVR